MGINFNISNIISEDEAGITNSYLSQSVEDIWETTQSIGNNSNIGNTSGIINDNLEDFMKVKQPKKKARFDDEIDSFEKLEDFIDENIEQIYVPKETPCIIVF